MKRIFHVRVTIPAIHRQLTRMEAVIEWNRLLRHVADSGVLGSPGIPSERNDAGSQRARANENLNRN